MKPSDTCIESALASAQQDPNPTTSKYVKDLLERCMDDDKAAEEISSLFPSDDKRISFGTAGLRAAMKPGPLSMNDLTIVQTAQGLAKYCLKQEKDESGKLKVVVGYDHRCNPTLEMSSLSFAIVTAMVLAEAGIDCILLDGFVLTPLVPFVVKEVGAAAGVMITASHNPKQDNGYKVYASDCCQIRDPMDKDIATDILENLSPWIDYGEKIEELKKDLRKKHVIDPCLGLSRPDTTNEMLDKYYKSLAESGLKTGQAKFERSPDSMDPPSFAYTAMHGIGHKFAVRVFEVFDLPAFKAVPEQRDPDFTFPTVAFPNPEEKGAMDLAKKFAEDNKCDVVLANDPDADRLAVAERDRSSGEWSVFTGDQIGSMLGLWIWEQLGKDCGKVRYKCKIKIAKTTLRLTPDA
jgi:phosphomannomutase